MLLENHLAALGTLVQDRMTVGFGGMSPSAAAILLTLANRGPLPVSELAGIVGVTQPTATRLLDGLAQEGFVVRGKKQGRRVEISLTRAGTRKAGAHQRKRDEAAAELLGPLKGRERAALAKLIAAILAGATGTRAFARTTCRFCDHRVCRGDDCPIGSRAAIIEREAGTTPC
jgi:DNA-binding MarR family transcriptional regulator